MNLTGNDILERVNRAIQVGEVEFPRSYIGMSGLGHPCKRKIYFDWRWYSPEQFTPRIRRLFNRGHREESRFAYYLRVADIVVESVDPDTGKQFEFVSSDGHCQGHSDSRLTFATTKLVGEFKTHNKNQFSQVIRINRVRISHYSHWLQLQRYGHEMGVKWGLYCAVCKDNDALHFEVVKMDPNAAEFSKDKERDIYESKGPPDRVADNEDYYICKMCWYSDLCFGGDQPVKNCRTCSNSKRANKGVWKCGLTKQLLSLSDQWRGCQKYKLE